MAGQRNNYGKRSHSQSDYGDKGGSKRRNSGGDKEQFVAGQDDTVYRYLCPVKKIGSIMGKGGDIIKQLRAESGSKIRIGDTVQGCDERVVTIYSSSKESNTSEDTGDSICPAQDALFKIHSRIIAEDALSDEDTEVDRQVTARLLVPSDQIGCVIGKAGQVVQGIRTDTGALIRILKDENLPYCAMNTDELLQVSGEASNVKKALHLLASRLHDNPSRSQHLLTASTPSVYQQSVPLLGSNGGGPIMGLAPLMDPYGGYKTDAPYYPPPRDESSARDFSIRMICSVGSVGGVIGKGGVIIKQIRQESGAYIKVDSSAIEGDDCIISISAKEFYEDHVSPTIDAAVRLQPRCSEKSEKEDARDAYFMTRLLVPASRIGCLIGKGGSVITEMRKHTRANIRILSKEDLPKIALADDEMVQISGDIEVAKTALVQVLTRLRANVFEREGALSSYAPPIPYYPPFTTPDDSISSRLGSKDSRSHGRGYSSYSSGYDDPRDMSSSDGYGIYGNSQTTAADYGVYGSYSGRSATAG